ncbi:hypothetical protein GB937_003718 [Aspergillus fischeri]|nr:hypothetical protein GB937_003718 [Aspergillus fischeri]
MAITAWSCSAFPTNEGLWTGPRGWAPPLRADTAMLLLATPSVLPWAGFLKDVIAQGKPQSAMKA